jgi:NAD/NADP transhydrogenase beta subunit
MPKPAQPEILPPGVATSASASSRLRVGSRLFSDENLDILAHLLDDCFRIPGTPIRFGLDGLIGLVPGLGDVLAGLASCILIIAAWLRGVPYITLVRMLVNLGLDVIIGAIPFLGDIFDIAWKANRRNYKLLTLHLREPRRHTWKDYVFLLGLAIVVLAILATPVFVLLWIVSRMFSLR